MTNKKMDDRKSLLIDLLDLLELSSKLTDLEVRRAIPVSMKNILQALLREEEAYDKAIIEAR